MFRGDALSDLNDGLPGPMIEFTGAIGTHFEDAMYKYLNSLLDPYLMQFRLDRAAEFISHTMWLGPDPLRIHQSQGTNCCGGR